MPKLGITLVIRGLFLLLLHGCSRWTSLWISLGEDSLAAAPKPTPNRRRRRDSERQEGEAERKPSVG